LKAFRGRVALTAAFAEMDMIIVNANCMYLISLAYKRSNQFYNFSGRAVSDGTAIDDKDIHVVLLEKAYSAFSTEPLQNVLLSF